MKRMGIVGLVLCMVLLVGCAGKGAKPGDVPPTPGAAASTDNAGITAPATSSAPAAGQSQPPAPVVAEPSPPAPPNVDGVEGFYPRGTQTGTPVVDRFLGAVWNGKAGDYLGEAQRVSLPCVPRAGLDGPVCPKGTAAGTVVAAYPYAWCNLTFEPDQRTWRGYTEAAFRGGIHLYAVYHTGEVPGLGKRPAYGVVMGQGLADSSAPTFYLGEDGSFLLARWGCGLPTLAVPSDATGVLAPKVTATAAQRTEAEAGLTSVVAGELQMAYQNLRVGLGEVDPCKDSKGACIGGPGNLADAVQGVIVRCDKVGPEAQMSGYAYDEARMGALFRPYLNACNTLRLAEAAMGQPKDTPEWRAAAVKARALLEPAVRLLDGGK